MIDRTSANARRYGLSYRQIDVLNLIERGFNRAAIAQELGISLESVRSITVGMCSTYDCPARDLPDKIKDGVTADGDGDNSLYRVLMDAHRYINDDDFDPEPEWIDELVSRIEGGVRTITVGASREKSNPNHRVTLKADCRHLEATLREIEHWPFDVDSDATTDLFQIKQRAHDALQATPAENS